MSDSNYQLFFNNFNNIKTKINKYCDNHFNKTIQDIFNYLNMINSKINTIDIKIRNSLKQNSNMNN